MISPKNIKEVFHGRIFNIKVEDYSKFSIDVVEHPGAVVILPIIDRNLILIKQYRYPIKEEIYELPAGTLKPEERPEDCAKRELEEETGYRAKTVKFLGKFYSSPGYSTEILFSFLAKDLTMTSQKLDTDEIIKVHRFSFNEVLRMIKDGVIKDSKTIATIYLYELLS